MMMICARNETHVGKYQKKKKKKTNKQKHKQKQKQVPLLVVLFLIAFWLLFLIEFNTDFSPGGQSLPYVGGYQVFVIWLPFLRRSYTPNDPIFIQSKSNDPFPLLCQIYFTQISNFRSIDTTVIYSPWNLFLIFTPKNIGSMDLGGNFHPKQNRNCAYFCFVLFLFVPCLKMIICLFWKTNNIIILKQIVSKMALIFFFVFFFFVFFSPLSKTPDNYKKRMIERIPAQQGLTLQSGSFLNILQITTKNKEQNRTCTKMQALPNITITYSPQHHQHTPYTMHTPHPYPPHTQTHTPPPPHRPIS